MFCLHLMTNSQMKFFSKRGIIMFLFLFFTGWNVEITNGYDKILGTSLDVLSASVISYAINDKNHYTLTSYSLC